MLRRERHDGRRPAERRGDRGAVKIVRAHLPGRRELLDMAMAVDSARHHQPPARFDHPRAAEALTDLRDLLAADANIRAPRLLRGRERPAAYHNVKRHKGILL